jgi:UDP-2,3-diacylglucosamine pyrophosphatase LpxH
MGMRQAYRALWLSDIHLGTAASRAGDLLAFLREVSADVIYLTGDIVDLQRLKVRPRFPALHWQVVTRFLELAGTGTRVIYVPGNHDIEFRKLAGRQILGIEVALEKSHECAGGQRLLVIHGDCLDRRIRRGNYVEQFGSAAYRWLVEADARINQLRHRLGRDYSSISTKIKMRLRSANEYIRSFEETATRYALRRGFDGVVCGHIHRPCIRDINGMLYANDGDWVEHRSALAETADGQIQLLRWSAGSVIAEPAFLSIAIAA